LSYKSALGGSPALMRKTRAANDNPLGKTDMSPQEIIIELTKLSREELAQVDLKLHELLEEKRRTGGQSWGQALLEIAGTVEGLPSDYAENHDHYLHGRPHR
jgi:hypothetical protein